MSYELPPPAEIVRSSAHVARRLAESARLRGDNRFADALERRAAIAEQRACFLDEIARVRAARAHLLELRLIADHEASVCALEED